MKVILIEDEERAVGHLTRLLRKSYPEIEIIASLESIADSISYLKKNNEYDLIFSDIQLADGLSFEIFRVVKINCPIIFTTAYDHYAIEAFNTNGIDYLLKPVEEERLKQSVTKAKRFSVPPSLEKIIALASAATAKQYKTRFMVRAGDKIRTVPTIEVTAFYSSDKSTWIHTTGNRDYPVEYTLDQLEEMLDPVTFFRINRKYIVSTEACRNITAWSNSRLKLRIEGINDNEIIVARERVQDFKQWLDQ